MSIKLMAQVWERKMDHPEQSVLLAMADHAQDDGSDVFPSILRIAWKTGYSARQVKRIGKDLRTKGALILVAPATKTRATEYRIDLDALPKKETFQAYYQREQSEVKVSPQGPSGDEGTSTQDEGTPEKNEGTSPVESGDTVMAPKPSEEPPSLKPLLKPPLAPKRKMPGLVRHPAIRLFRSITGHLPLTVQEENVIALLKESPNEAFLRQCYKAWVDAGYKKFGMNWLYEWYPSGVIPERPGQRNNGTSKNNSSTASGDDFVFRPKSVIE